MAQNARRALGEVHKRATPRGGTSIPVGWHLYPLNNNVRNQKGGTTNA